MSAIFMVFYTRSPVRVVLPTYTYNAVNVLASLIEQGRKISMAPIIWYVVFEDVILLAASCALIYTRKRLYILVAFITLLLLVLTTALLLYGNHNLLLVIVPTTVFVLMNLIVRPFIRQNYRNSNPVIARIVVIILFSFTLLLIIIGVFIRST
jgi:hypothetical protein